MFLKNCWYIVGHSGQFQNELLARTVCGEQIVLFRNSQGVVSALEDRCPHRLVPLSIGRVVGDNLRCGYHGAEFNDNGRCVKVPGQKAVSSSVRVRSYPLVERHGFFWVWLGDPALSSDESSIPGGFWRSDADGWRGAYGYFNMGVDYRMLNDNLIDVTHAEFVHPESFGGEELHFFRNARRGTDYLERGMSFNIADRSIHFRLSSRDLGDEGGLIWRQMIAESRGLQGYSGNVHFTIDVDWWAPSYCSFLLSVRPADEPEAELVRICNLHAAIPEAERTSNYYFRSVRNYGGEDSAVIMQQIGDFIFGQDKPVLEAQQRKVGDHDVFDLSPISFAGDRLPMEARRIIGEMLAQEVSAVELMAAE